MSGGTYGGIEGRNLRARYAHSLSECSALSFPRRSPCVCPLSPLLQLASVLGMAAWRLSPGAAFSLVHMGRVRCLEDAALLKPLPLSLL